MQVDVPRECKPEKLGESRGVGPLVRAGADAQWKVMLRPYDLAAARFSAPQVRLRNPRVTVPEQVRTNLQRRIRDLGARVAALGNPQPISTLVNSSFELPLDGEDIPGWTVGANMNGSVALDGTQKRSGGQSLKLASAGQGVGVVSEPFDSPATGRLAVEVWLRSAEGMRQPSLRISLEGDLRDGKFDPYGVIPAVGASAATPGDWVRYSFPLDYLPSEGLGQLRVGFELMGSGEVWIEDVQIFDLAFSEAERNELAKLISLASVVLEKGQLADCSQLLEGYWPQFLMTHVPLAHGNTPVAQRVRDSRVPGVGAPPPKKPTLLENLREYIPRLPRM
jgi:hypothetical protein